MWHSTYLSSFSSSRTYRAAKQNKNVYRAFIAISFLIYSKHSACQCHENEKWVINYCYTGNCLLCSGGGNKALHQLLCQRSQSLCQKCCGTQCFHHSSPQGAGAAGAAAELGSPAVRAVPRTAASLLTGLLGLHPMLHPSQSLGDCGQPRAVRPIPMRSILCSLQGQ